MNPDFSHLRTQHLAGTEWLAERLYDPSIRIADMRGYVRAATEPDGRQTAIYTGARIEYEAKHIPGAVYLDWTTDIVDLGDPVPAQIAPPDKIAAIFGSSGIGDGTLVVAYDNHPASQFATRLWWALKYYGHDAVRVLDGGWQQWLSEGRPTSNSPSSPTPAIFTPQVRPEWRRTAGDILASLESRTTLLVDARDKGQYSGQIRRGLHGGHIPGALHLPREALLSKDGRFLPPSELESAAMNRGVTPDKQIVAYCNGGVAATSVLFALSMLGYENLGNYDGSWNEWGNRDDLPFEPSA
jgi:thiosulfate/3-mercaptopyruvate sulfurtransferase